MEVVTNVFCASGMHLPNDSYATFGGNGAVGVGGNIGSNLVRTLRTDMTYQDYDGRNAIRILNPCTDGDDFTSAECAWFDNPSVLAMQKERWYSAAEALADGTVVLIGGFVNGGYINRNYPNTDPEYEGGAAEPTYETLDLPDMPGEVVRVYPASGAVAMLPLTPANNYTPTVLFCGGSNMTDSQWGDYSWPVIDTLYYPASADCQRLTPEPTDGSTPAYDDMLEPRENGTVGYSENTDMTLEYGQMPYGMLLAAAPVSTPAIYDPDANSGSRWSNAGLEAASLPRLYHSSAILLPDASAEIFHPSYFSSSTRPVPTGTPTTLSYGGSYFDIAIPPSSYSGSANDAAANTTVMVIRPGWTTHAMNMGQRYLQLNTTYMVNDNGTITMHASQMPPNQPGPAMVFVVVNGIPSNGSFVIVGTGGVETQPLSTASELPASVLVFSNASGSGANTS
ncbi:DUF1929-domain-containing protein [Gymnopus androsaceus JB14]|uniref:DUF1929-domain-containing protein n=1 Tax=Gymnopus androsaceus JB14 TaxID=1447944 RepID=A0A6A4H5M3_9AGAR|nr:DUF1929-domain-containing protein [Gymnopus androsaceus JB14]